MNAFPTRIALTLLNTVFLDSAAPRLAQTTQTVLRLEDAHGITSVATVMTAPSSAILVLLLDKLARPTELATGMSAKLIRIAQS